MKKAKKVLFAFIIAGVLICLSTSNMVEANLLSEDKFQSITENVSLSKVDFKVTAPKPETSTLPSITQTPSADEATPTNTPTANTTDLAKPTNDSVLTENAGAIVTVGGILTLVAVYLVANRLKKEA